MAYFLPMWSIREKEKEKVKSGKKGPYLACKLGRGPITIKGQHQGNLQC